MELQINSDKQKLRADARALRKKIMSEEEGKMASLQIQERLMSRVEWQQAKTIILYYAVHSEVGTALLLEQAVKDGKTVFLPRCRENGIMQMLFYNFSVKLEISAYGIPEPPLTARSVSERELHAGKDTLIVVPGLAFDRKGIRLGAGGGYYDRFLPKTRCLTVGLTFDPLFVDSLPSDKWDIPVNAVCTEKQFFKIPDN